MTKSQPAGGSESALKFEMAPGDSSAGLGRLKPIVEWFGPVVTDESDPRRPAGTCLLPDSSHRDYDGDLAGGVRVMTINLKESDFRGSSDH